MPAGQLFRAQVLAVVLMAAALTVSCSLAPARTKAVPMPKPASVASESPALKPSVDPIRNTSVSPSREGYVLPTTTVAGYEHVVTPTIPDLLPRDPYLLAQQLRHLDVMATSSGERASPPKLGDQERFWLSNLDGGETYEITATLRAISPHLYMWVQDGVAVDSGALDRSAQTFEERIYPVSHALFGSEWSPGIDRDEHISVLNAEFTGASGYFSNADEYPRQVNPYSNEREMIYINLLHRTPGTDLYSRTLAHELQHLTHWYADRNEDAWVTEGASELAEVSCGFGPQDVTAFMRNPDIQLTTWGSAGGGIARRR